MMMSDMVNYYKETIKKHTIAIEEIVQKAADSERFKTIAKYKAPILRDMLNTAYNNLEDAVDGKWKTKVLHDLRNGIEVTPEDVLKNIQDSFNCECFSTNCTVGDIIEFIASRKKRDDGEIR